MSQNRKEKRFLDALRALFTGAAVEGASGYINLMHIKHRYLSQMLPALQEKFAEADGLDEGDGTFREEMFDKLHAFFSRYFCSSGSIYFHNIPAHYPARVPAFGNGADVELVWKTRDVYYVKSDRLVQSMPVRLDDSVRTNDGARFFFDAGKLQNKQNNERREFVFRYGGLSHAPERGGSEETPALVLQVEYANNGHKTDWEAIAKSARKDGEAVGEEQLEQASAVFERQREVDFYVHKNAGAFLHEQFDQWMYQYLFRKETEFSQQRIAQLRCLKDAAAAIIGVIAQFEDELARVWRKPKIARNANYVVTLNKLTAVIRAAMDKHPGMAAQIAEWEALGIPPAKNGADTRPIDTRHFKSLEGQILADLGDLDEALDGEMIRSENWQALNTLRHKYHGRIKCIYIDPPFNLEESDQFDYRTNYKDSSWATMLHNRLELARDFLRDNGAVFVRCDHNGNWIVRCLMDALLTPRNFYFQNELVVNRFQKRSNGFTTTTESVFLYCPDDVVALSPIEKGRTCTYCNAPIEPKWNWAHSAGASDAPRYFDVDGKRTLLHPPRGRHWTNSQDTIDELTQQGRMRINHALSYRDSKGNKVDYQPEKLQSSEIVVDSNWTDIPGYVFGIYSEEKFSTQNAEELVARIIQSSSQQDDIAFDFFSGSGTTQAVAQKLGRKWLGVEMGEHFDTVILPRLKKALAGHQSGISAQTSYKGGGAFVYYALEQYEETLKKCVYKDSDLLDAEPDKQPWEQYPFLADDKLVKPAASVAGEGEDATAAVDLAALYADADLPQTLANLAGSPVRRINDHTITLANGDSYPRQPKTPQEHQQLRDALHGCLWWKEQSDD